MCLAVPAHIVEREGSTAVADLHGNRLRINVALVPDVHVGDWVLVHAGFAIQRLSEDDALETFGLMRELIPGSES